ncbi:hypothetical protein GX48_04045 [Paracoccidioides brasiliensis]|nr:hypothetical protein GX48_04045 [Paracoccidioides brasiliensis]
MSADQEKEILNTKKLENQGQLSLVKMPSPSNLVASVPMHHSYDFVIEGGGSASGSLFLEHQADEKAVRDEDHGERRGGEGEANRETMISGSPFYAFSTAPCASVIKAVSDDDASCAWGLSCTRSDESSQSLINYQSRKIMMVAARWFTTWILYPHQVGSARTGIILVN